MKQRRFEALTNQELFSKIFNLFIANQITITNFDLLFLLPPS
ncbi:hypothetical protein HanPSC8_Chr16g0730581 [Helianthus annuus]|nr:hypothetical protein HanPSC8_Chr16g0730581 [Helianthus annuus]